MWDSSTNPIMDLTLAELVTAIIVGAAGLVLFFSIVSRSLHRRAENRAVRSSAICRLCLHSFPREIPKGTVICPECSAVNDPGRDGLAG